MQIQETTELSVKRKKKSQKRLIWDKHVFVSVFVLLQCLMFAAPE